jgi:MFS family permease
VADLRGELSRMRWATLAVFFANGFGIGSWAAAIPTLKIALALSDAELSLALLAFAAGALVCMPLCSVLTPRLGGTGPTTRLAGLMFAVLLPLPLLAGGLPTLIAAAFVTGASSGLVDVAMNAHASVVERRRGAAIMSSFHAAFSLGGIAGAGLEATLLAMHTPRYWLLVPASGVALALVLFALPRLGPGDRAESSRVALRIPERTLVGLATVALLCLFVEGSMTDWSALYLTTVGASPASASTGFVAFSAMMVVGRLLGDHAVRVFGGQDVIAAGALLAGAGLTLAAALPLVPVIAFGFALVGLGLSNVVPALFSAGARRGSSPAAGIAATATAGYAGMLAGPPVIGAIATGWSLRVGIAVLALIVIGAAIISACSNRFGAPRQLPE